MNTGDNLAFDISNQHDLLYAKGTGAIVYQIRGLTVRQGRDCLIASLAGPDGTQQVELDYSKRDKLRGNIELENTILEYWLDENQREWHLIHRFKSEIQGEFSKEWLTNHVSIPLDNELISVDFGGEPGDPRTFPVGVAWFGYLMTILLPIGGWLVIAYFSDT